ncbi:MAG TPA: CheR family methyltransferase, partial [Spirochaetota bacterium]|nr:CheR family methyltransferase [Spirochaetota bacterium]HOL57899.1 CheR family methyltransferase [Spirochaetota bacterium]HPP05217.1 CheR family methyltransferase [Spirochaetota bacterium]
MRDIILSDYLFKKLVEYFYKETGISLKEYKKYLVEHRLSRFIGEGSRFRDFNEFYNALIEDKTGELKSILIQSLTTNWTYFFRENIHFEFLKEYLRENWDKQRYIRLWSAGCSTGEEAYSMAIVSKEVIPEIEKIDFRILATDISLKVLNFAINGVYNYSKIKTSIEDHTLKRYFI